MAYSQLGIINLAFTRLGVARITSAELIALSNAQAKDADAVWEYIRDEVLSMRDWKFAKTRVALEQNETAPETKWDYAYDLPSDFIRLCLTRPDDPNVTSEEYEDTFFIGDTLVIKRASYKYSIETLYADGTMCLMTNFDNTSYDLYIPYIRQVIDPTKYSSLFISALAFRLAAELSLTRTESRAKYTDMMNLYGIALKQADAFNASMEQINNETGTPTRWDLAR